MNAKSLVYFFLHMAAILDFFKLPYISQFRSYLAQNRMLNQIFNIIYLVWLFISIGADVFDVLCAR